MGILSIIDLFLQLQKGRSISLLGNLPAPLNCIWDLSFLTGFGFSKIFYLYVNFLSYFLFCSLKKNQLSYKSGCSHKLKLSWLCYLSPTVINLMINSNRVGSRKSSLSNNNPVSTHFSKNCCNPCLRFSMNSSLLPAKKVDFPGSSGTGLEDMRERFTYILKYISPWGCIHNKKSN